MWAEGVAAFPIFHPNRAVSVQIRRPALILENYTVGWEELKFFLSTF